MRTMRSVATVVIMAGLAISPAACGGDGGGTGPGGGGGGGNASFSATVGGAAFSASGPLALAVTTAKVPGSVTIQGTSGPTNNLTTVALVLANISGTGTYPLGVSTMVPGGLATVYTSATAWTTALSGAAGTVNITSLTAARIAGTFSFRADTGLGTSPAGALQVTSGQFDVPLTGALAAVPDNYGDRMSAGLGATSWNAAFIGTTLNGSGLSFTTFTTDYFITINLTGVNAVGSYALSASPPSRIFEVSSTIKDATHCCWGINVLDTGTVTITSLTATRVKGTFHAVLQPIGGMPATAPLTIAGGTFDVGLR